MSSIEIRPPINRIGNSQDYILVNPSTNLVEVFINGVKVADVDVNGKLRLKSTIAEGVTF